MSMGDRRNNSFKVFFLYFKLNIKKILSFPANLIIHALITLLDNSVWLVFWLVYFNNFNYAYSSSSYENVLLLWSIASVGYGLCNIMTGNAIKLSTIISSGKLDAFLGQPVKLLPNVLMSNSNASGFGDVIFGTSVFLFLTDPSFSRILFFLLSASLAFFLFVGFLVTVHSLSFYIGQAEMLSRQMLLMLIHFSTYPSVIFKSFMKFILFTILPAGIIHTLASDIVIGQSFSSLLWVVAFVLLFNLIGFILFYRGLKRYESGNYINMHG